MIEKKRKYGGNGLLFAALTVIAPICGCDSLDQVGDFVGGIPFTDPDGDDPTTNEPALTEFLPTGTLLNYDIKITGSANGTTRGQFTQDAVISVQPAFGTATTNDINPFEVFLAAGYPSVIPKAGAIQYSTSLAFYVSTDVLAAIDLSLVTIATAQPSVTLRPAGENTALGVSQNFFTAESGALAELYLITEGEIILSFSDEGKTIDGIIQSQGIGVAFQPTNGSYTATFEGTLRE
jgi:hypothetical protein